jgi:two-component system OmpR family sensor kinase
MGYPSMTLRLRLVLALVALVTAGLVVFGVVTYQLYARSQYDRLDDQAASLVEIVYTQLASQAGIDTDGFGNERRRPGGRGRRPPPVVVPPGTYAELRDGGGGVLANVQLQNSDAEPDLAEDLVASGTEARFLSTGSVDGSIRWRVLITPAPDGSDRTVVVAAPSTEVRSSLRRLVGTLAVAAAVLLGLLAAGSWFILRRGLQPLERMADSARTMTVGGLSQRVGPADDKTEVGQLGLALNTMLGDLEAAFAEREATERKLRQFLADASHELRTPLTTIGGFAELFRLADGNPEQVDLPVVMRRIEEESGRMKALVEDLLLLARLDRTRVPERRPVDLAVLAADACSDAVATEPGRPVTLDASGPVVVDGDAHHLRQAIANLVTNALRHTPPGTPIEVGAQARDGRATVTVRDHGPGFDEEARRHLFDRFWRADPSRTGGGAGLGLSIVAGIAAEHGGEATAENAPGGGALFTLRLPVGSGDG